MTEVQPVEIVGELFYRIRNPLGGRDIVRSCLIGDDLKLYSSDYPNRIDPKKQLWYKDDDISQLLYSGIIELPDGTSKLEQTAWEPYLLGDQD